MRSASESTPDVLQYLLYPSTFGDEGDQAQLPNAHRVQQRKHLVDAGDQNNRPQAVTAALSGELFGANTPK